MLDSSKYIMNELGTIGLMISADRNVRGVPPFPGSYYGYVSHPEFPILLQTSPWIGVLLQKGYLFRY